MICVIFATFNGERTLPRMLSALTKQTLSSDQWSLIAVDNNSNDKTPDILNAYLDQLPLTVLQHENPGKNGAMNAAIAHIEDKLSEFDLIVCTDDDIIADPDWLETLSRLAHDKPHHDLFGGAISLLWPTEPETWLLALKDEYYMIFAERSLETGQVNADEIYGPNMAFRPGVFAAGHGFNESIGPDGRATYAMGAETEFLRRMAVQGHKAWFTADAKVGHIIREEQMFADWILGRAYRSGLGNAYVKESRRLPGIGVPAWLLRSYLVHAMPAWLAKLGPRTPQGIAKQFHFNWIKGAIAQARAIDLQASSRPQQTSSTTAH